MKKNPTIQIKQSKLNDIKREATANAMGAVTIMFLMALRDKEGYDTERLKKVFDEVNELSELVVGGYIDLNSCRKILLDEANINVDTESLLRRRIKMI